MVYVQQTNVVPGKQSSDSDRGCVDCLLKQCSLKIGLFWEFDCQVKTHLDKIPQIVSLENGA